MSGFFFIWGITFLMAFATGIFDKGYKQPWVERALRAAGYTFVISVVISIFSTVVGGGSREFDVDTYYRR